MVFSVTCQPGILLQLELEGITVPVSSSFICMGGQQSDRTEISEIEKSAGSRARYVGRTEERITACHKEEM